MVRVGGGWDSLDHFLLKHDPCRVHAMSGTHTQPLYCSFRIRQHATPVGCTQCKLIHT